MASLWFGCNSRLMTLIAILLFGVCLSTSKRVPSSLRVQPEKDFTNRTLLGAAIPPRARAKVHRVADLLLDVYQTLVTMRYFDPEAIEEGPHDIDVDLCREQNISKSIIYLWQILPYVNLDFVEATAFIFGGTFVDFRDQEHILNSRNPMYAIQYDNLEGCGSDCDYAESGELNLPYMKPDMTILSNLGSRQCVLIYDLKTDRIWIIDQIAGNSCDPALQETPSAHKFDRNRNAFTHEPSRPASELLKDLANWYRDLSQIPGGDVGYGVPAWDYDKYKSLYYKHGWLDSFDGFAFQADLERYRAREIARYYVDEPKYQWWDLLQWRRYVLDDFQRLSDEDAAAVTEDQRYLVSFKLWQTQCTEDRILERLQQADDDYERLCPEGDCQDPATVLRLEIDGLRSGLELAGADTFANLIRRSRRVALLGRALQDAEAEAEAQGVSLGLHQRYQKGAYEEDIRLARECASDQQALSSILREIEEVEDWLTKAPVEAHKTKNYIAHDVDQLRSTYWIVQSRIKRAARWNLDMWQNPSTRAIVTTCRVVA